MGLVQNKKSTFVIMLKKIFVWLLAIFLLFQLQYILRIVWFSTFEPSSTPYMRVEEERLNKDGFAKLQYQWVDYSKISPYMIKAVVAGEDAKFIEHSGVDWNAILKALNSNLIKDKRAPGGSTLTQQTVKNLFLSHDRSYLRKAEEIFLAKVVELLWSKKRILEVYLNIAEFGNGIFGVQAAARHYFKTNASALTRQQSVWLASILINPKKYQNRQITRHLKQRITRISHDLNLVTVPERN